MKKEYEFYIKNIKPLEKKYYKFCILYSIFKLEYFYHKKKFYNKLLVHYYKTIKNNKINVNNFEESIK